jgi:hypothetical protein
MQVPVRSPRVNTVSAQQQCNTKPVNTEGTPAPVCVFVVRMQISGPNKVLCGTSLLSCKSYIITKYFVPACHSNC